MIDKLLVKIETTKEPGTWLVRDQCGSVRSYVPPSFFPRHVLRAIESAGAAYFWVVRDGGNFSFGSRMVGDPGWV